jgi:hypothetical protein
MAAHRREYARPMKQARIAKRDRGGVFIDEVVVEPDVRQELRSSWAGGTKFQSRDELGVFGGLQALIEDSQNRY